MSKNTTTTRQWEPIRRGQPQAKSVEPNDKSLLIIEIPLSRRPEAQWEDFFEDPPNDPAIATIWYDMPRPFELVFGTVRTWAPDDKIEEYVRRVDERIEQANAWYEENILPGVLAEEERERREREDIEHRLREARRQTERL